MGKEALMAMDLNDTEGCEKVADKKDDKKDAESRISPHGFLPALHPKKDDKKDEKKDDKKDEKKDDKKSRILQALKVKATVPKVAVKAKVTVPKVAVKAKVTVPKVTVPKVGIKVTVPKVAVKGKVTVKKAVVSSDIFAWSMTAKIGDATPADKWNAYIKIPQAPAVPSIKMTNDCMAKGSFKRFFETVMFGKLTDKRVYTVTKPIFDTMKYLNDTIANKEAKAVYARLMGKTWFAKLKLQVKTGAKSATAGVKKIGLKIKASTKKAVDATKDAAKKVGDASKKIAADVHKTAKAGAAKISAGVKGGLKVNAKVTVPKVHIKAKVGTRRLQSVTPKATTVSGNTNGLNTSAYSGDVSVPTTLAGDADQSAPAFANLIKMAFASFAILMTMF